MALPAATLSASFIHALDTAPILTKSTTACLLAGMGDTIAQLLTSEEGVASYSLPRTLKFSAWALLTTPFVHTWYKHVIAKIHSPVRRVLCDQLLWAPPSTALFLLYSGGPQRVVENFPQTAGANLLVWAPVSLVNFYFLPSKFWVVTNSVVGLGWAVGLSLLSQSSPRPAKVPSNPPTSPLPLLA